MTLEEKIKEKKLAIMESLAEDERRYWEIMSRPHPTKTMGIMKFIGMANEPT